MSQYILVDRTKLESYCKAMVGYCDDCLSKHGVDTYCLHRDQFPRSKCGLGVMVNFLKSLLEGKCPELL